MIVSIYDWERHEPFGPVYRLADLVQPAREFELGAAQLILGGGAPADFQRLRT